MFRFSYVRIIIIIIICCVFRILQNECVKGSMEICNHEIDPKKKTNFKEHTRKKCLLLFKKKQR